MDPTAGKLSAAIADVTTDLLTELSQKDAEDGPSVEEQIDMFQYSPILGPCADALVMLGLMQFGEYHHDDEDLEQWVRANFSGMRGSWKRAIAEQYSSELLGHAVSEWYVIENEGEWLLDGIHVLHPKCYRFRVLNRELHDIYDRSSSPPVAIAMDRLIVTVKSQYLTFGNPYNATSIGRRCFTLWKAWKILINEMLVASQRQAVPITVAYSDSNDRVDLLDKNGNPLRDDDGNPVTISAPQDLLNQLLDLDNRSVISTDVNNRIEALATQTDGDFFVEALRVIQTLMFLSFGFPETIFQVGEGGLGNAGLNQGHLWIAKNTLSQTTEQIKEEIIEKPVRHLIEWNFGAQEDYGSFEEPEEETADEVALLGALSNAVSQGAFSAADLDVINRMRELAGIPEVSEAIAPVPTPMEQMSKAYWRTA